MEQYNKAQRLTLNSNNAGTEGNNNSKEEKPTSSLSATYDSTAYPILPYEVILQIIEHLSAQDLNSFSRTCIQLHNEITQNREYLWNIRHFENKLEYYGPWFKENNILESYWMHMNSEGQKAYPNFWQRFMLEDCLKKVWKDKTFSKIVGKDTLHGSEKVCGFLYDGKYTVTFDEEGEIQIWEFSRHLQSIQVFNLSEGSVELQYPYLITASYDGVIYVCHLPSSEILFGDRPQGSISCLKTMIPFGRDLIFTGSDEGTIVMNSLTRDDNAESRYNSMVFIDIFQDDRSNEIFHLCTSRNYLASCCDNDVITVRRINDDLRVYVVHKLKCHSESIDCLYLDDSRVICICFNDIITMWDLPSGDVRTVLDDLGYSFHSMTIFGKHVFIGDNEGQVYVYDMDNKKRLYTLQKNVGHSKKVRWISVTRSNIVTCGDDGRLIIWNGNTGELIRIFEMKGSDNRRMPLKMVSCSETRIVCIGQTTYSSLIYHIDFTPENIGKSLNDANMHPENPLCWIVNPQHVMKPLSFKSNY
ncbi:hypothetical protein ACOME3_005021 [Neoechinorhynchus agilis]